MRLSLRTPVVGAALALLVLGSAPSAFGAPVKPTAPSAVHAVAASAAVTVSWAKSPATGGLAITKYVVTSTPAAKTCTTRALSCRVSGLKNGTAYRFAVVAYNKNGAGTRSKFSNQVTPASSTGAKRILVVAPSKGLTNGETVKVTGTGFTPKDQVFLIECLATSTSQAGCDVTSAVPATVSATGTIAATSFTVITGSIGTGTCGTTRANAAACAINAGTITGGDAAQGLIAFKP